MRSIQTCFVLIAMAIGSTPALGQDDGGGMPPPPPDAAFVDTAYPADASAEAGDECQGLTYQGRCADDVLEYCMDGHIESVDCPSESAALTCGLIDCSDDDCYGYACVSGEGEGPCQEYACDIEQTLGCLDDVCAPSEVCNAETYLAGCLTETTITWCFAYSYVQYEVHPEAGVVWDYDCSQDGAESYVCGATSTGAAGCLGLEGALCDPSQGAECANDLTCTGGICTGASSRDAGNWQDSGTRYDTRSPERSTPDTNDWADRNPPEYDAGVRCNCAEGEICLADGTCAPITPRDGGSASAEDTHDASLFGCGLLAAAPAPFAAIGALALMLLRRRRRLV